MTPSPADAVPADRPLLSLCLITRDERHNVRRLLDNVWDSVDEVCVADTGSKDGTIAELRRYAKGRGQPGKLKVTRIAWTDDFAAARQAADDLATGEFVCWCDLDDEVRGLDRLRQMAAEAAEDVVGWFVRYNYARDTVGNPISELWRERVVRNDGTRWTGRLHEHKLFTRGQIIHVDPTIAEWVHLRDHTQRTGERNLRILESWDSEQPDDPTIIHALAMEYMGADRHEDAARQLRRLLQMPNEAPDRRAQSARYLCQMLMLLGRPEEARAEAYRAMQELPGWPDTHLSLAEVEQTLGRPDIALMHAQTALSIGKPQTVLIVNPLQYTAHPLALQALCLAQLGRFDEAVERAQEALQISPDYGLAAQHLPMYRAQLKRANVLASTLALVDVLVEAGELLKALELTMLAPYYIAEEPALIGRRVQLQHAIDERSGRENGAAEDEVADKFVRRHLEVAA